MAALHGGFHEDKVSAGATAIQVVVQHIGQNNGNSERTIEATTKAVGIVEPV
jgi:hypothetical protein